MQQCDNVYLYIFVDVQTSVMNWTLTHGPVRCIFVYQFPPVDAVTCIILKNCMWNICIKNVVDVRLWCFTWLLSHHTVVWLGYSVYCVLVCLFVLLQISQRQKKLAVAAWNFACSFNYSPRCTSPILVNFGRGAAKHEAIWLISYTLHLGKEIWYISDRYTNHIQGKNWERGSVGSQNSVPCLGGGVGIGDGGIA